VRSRFLSLFTRPSLDTSSDVLGERTLSNNSLKFLQAIAAQMITYGQIGCSGAALTLPTHCKNHDL